MEICGWDSWEFLAGVAVGGGLLALGIMFNLWWFK